MNRANFGNIITNGMQILSVGATTASHLLGRADTTLNNLTEEQRNLIKQTKAQRELEKAQRFQAKGESPYQHTTNLEAADIQAKKAENLKKYAYGTDKEEDINIDALFGKSPQAEERVIKELADIDYSEKMRQMYTLLNNEEKSTLNKVIENVIKSKQQGGNK